AALCFTVLLGAFFFLYTPIWNNGYDLAGQHLFAVPAIFGPPLLLSAWERATKLAQKRSLQRRSQAVVLSQADLETGVRIGSASSEHSDQSAERSQGTGRLEDLASSPEGHREGEGEQA